VTTQAFAGARSLEVKLQTGGSGDRYVGIAGLTPLAALRAGATVTFRFWFPAAAPLAGVQPFVQYVPPGGKPGSPTWIGTWKDKVALTPGAWNTITVQVPSGSQGAVELGIQWRLSSAWTGLVYVDAVAW
jgi:hypothetical protein